MPEKTIIRLQRPRSFLRTQILMSRFEIAMKDGATMSDPKKRLALWEDLLGFMVSCVVEPDKDTARDLLMDLTEEELFGYLSSMSNAETDDAASEAGDAAPLGQKPDGSGRG